ILEHARQDARSSVPALPRSRTMNRRAKVAISSIALAVVVLAAAVAAWIARMPRRVVMPPSELVPPSWETFRASAGHERHVGKAGIACRECHDYQSSGFKNPGTAPCVRCHDK